MSEYDLLLEELL